jgi:hypothetical protein
VDEHQEDALAGDFDAQWGEIEDDHRGFVERSLQLLPAAGRVLDAACGTREVLTDGAGQRSPAAGVDYAGAYLTIAAAKFPQVPTDKHDLQDLPY